MEIVTKSVAVTTTGSAGTAAGTAQTEAMHGFLLDVYLDYHASAPATTDVTIEYADGTGFDILARANSATDALLAPRASPSDNAGAPITGAYERFPLSGRLSVSVAQSDALSPCVTARFRYLRIS